LSRARRKYAVTIPAMAGTATSTIFRFSLFLKIEFLHSPKNCAQVRLFLIAPGTWSAAQTFFEEPKTSKVPHKAQMKIFVIIIMNWFTTKQ